MATKKRISPFDKEHMNTTGKGNKKLFVWTRFLPDYSDGLACAVAYDETSAKRMVLKQLGLERIRGSNWGKLHVFDIEDMRPVAFAVQGGA